MTIDKDNFRHRRQSLRATVATFKCDTPARPGYLHGPFTLAYSLLLLLAFVVPGSGRGKPSEHLVNGRATGWSYPLDDRGEGVSRSTPPENISFGFMSYYSKKYPYHYAQDFGGYKEGSPVYAVADGTITRIRKTNGYGGGDPCDSEANTLVVEHLYTAAGGAGRMVYLLYGHLKNIIQPNADAGQLLDSVDQELTTHIPVTKGQKIAELNDPCCVDEKMKPHLHLVVMPETLPIDYYAGYNDKQNNNHRVRAFNSTRLWSRDWIDSKGEQTVPIDDTAFFDTFPPVNAKMLTPYPANSSIPFKLSILSRNRKNQNLYWHGNLKAGEKVFILSPGTETLCSALTTKSSPTRGGDVSFTWTALMINDTINDPACITKPHTVGIHSFQMPSYQRLSLTKVTDGERIAMLHAKTKVIKRHDRKARRWNDDIAFHSHLPGLPEVVEVDAKRNIFLLNYALVNDFCKPGSTFALLLVGSTVYGLGFCEADFVNAFTLSGRLFVHVHYQKCSAGARGDLIYEITGESVEEIYFNHDWTS